MDLVLPMNTGAEAVETAIKVARRWGYQRKGVAPDRAEIIVCADNFHGRTTTIVGFSTDPDAREDFGPFTPGFVTVPYGDADALRAAITDNTVGFLVEPVQGEAGVVVPPAGYLAGVPHHLPRRERLADGRRDPVGPRSYRAHVRVRARACPARHLHLGQGARRRHRSALGDRGRP